MTKRIHTIHGPVEIEELGLILPHEHLFTDLRGPHVPDHAQADRSHVTALVLFGAYPGSRTASFNDMKIASEKYVGDNLSALHRL